MKVKDFSGTAINGKNDGPIAQQVSGIKRTSHSSRHLKPPLRPFW
jgi:hypothetical protein